ncbi:hypothetical protein Ae201684_009241 [Aphanomyces euteiches]|uniref:Uncharacterized protein n=1 Tax=Aphanomyces euteiches TaxID=100861 RepID=A0A6G0X2L1_9STRA|nr:hypothetical protein Ae201684_009241 [Aphanomyces euteiches]
MLPLDRSCSIRRLITCLAGTSCDSSFRRLHSTTQAQHQVQGRFLLDVVVGKGATVFKLLASEDQALLIRGNAFLVLDFLLHVVNGVRRFHVKRDGLARQSLDEDLHTTTQAQHQVQGRLLLDVVVREGATIFKLLAGKNQALLIRGNAFLVLDLLLNIIDGVRRLNIERDGLAGKGLHEDLHTAAKTQHQMQSGFLLDVVVREGAAIFELLAGKNQTLLIRRDTFLVLDLLLDVVNGIRRFHVERDGLAGKGLDEDLHGALLCREKNEK